VSEAFSWSVEEKVDGIGLSTGNLPPFPDTTTGAEQRLRRGQTQDSGLGSVEAAV